MKKKKLLFLLLVLTIALVACSSNEEPIQPSETVVEQGDTEPAISEPSDSEPNQAVDMTVFEQFEKGLKEAGISYETVRMAAEYIGAEEGYKYKIGNGSVELYVYDSDSEAYEKAVNSQKVTLEGFGDFPATVKNGMCITISDLDEEPYLSIFESIK